MARLTIIVGRVYKSITPTNYISPTSWSFYASRRGHRSARGTPTLANLTLHTFSDISDVFNLIKEGTSFRLIPELLL